MSRSARVRIRRSNIFLKNFVKNYRNYTAVRNYIGAKHLMVPLSTAAIYEYLEWGSIILRTGRNKVFALKTRGSWYIWVSCCPMGAR